ncbi:anhydro-N-acetylmuramic acid kinase [Elioraea sp.]|uniref:anhydro-N-acetylmuramic acid kinase n=1 Tax=Elioraea sp. TaxID=2185103 RepID=UPI0021DDE800|nr:anhydro-N-acetylmuramic acid kinase [Elioraea sp.]GIX08755.1 MAG: anhydro-N-acetylmuramic acid kinase [Elioraea sp.]
MGAKPGLHLGLMSGTSLDGVDAALVETDGEGVARPGASLTLPYDAALRGRLRGLLDRAETLARDDPELAEAERALTDRHAEAVAALLARAGVAARAVVALGFHGQTILHRPERRLTWQIGDAARLAQATGIAVVHDFRSADVAAGGQGAPLAPLWHAALAGGLARPLAVLNLGGVGNVTWIGADGVVLACDTGPGNGPLDDWVAGRAGVPYDEGGRIAAAGRVAVAVLARLMAHPFFAVPPPKSLDRLDFARALEGSGLAALSTADGAATLAAFTAASVAAVRAHLPAPPLRWLVTGGGRHNAAIMGALRAALGAPVDPVEAVGWDGDALEAQAFAYLAARSLRGLPLSLPTTTGVPEPMPGGRVARPR